MNPRPITPEPRTFDHFPEHSICPICGTNNDGKTVLVPIAGTLHGELTEAKPVHLACAVIQVWDEGLERNKNMKAQYDRWREKADSIVCRITKQKDHHSQQIWKINQELDVLLSVMANGASGGTRWMNYPLGQDDDVMKSLDKRHEVKLAAIQASEKR